MARHKVIALFTPVLLLLAASVAHAVPMTNFDQNITAIFGDGNSDTNWTTDVNGNLVLGLRAKVRFNDANLPENTYNSNGDGTYSHLAGVPPGGGFGFAPGSPSTARWNFEWSINVGDAFLGDPLLSYLLMIDFDPGLGTNFQSFDPINVPSADHAIGDSATANGDGVEAASGPAYLALLGANSIAQNSWNMEFFDNGAFPFSAAADGVYTIKLQAFDMRGQSPEVLATTSIDVIVGAGAVEVPVPATALLFFGGLLGMGLVRRRRKTIS